MWFKVKFIELYKCIFFFFLLLLNIPQKSLHSSSRRALFSLLQLCCGRVTVIYLDIDECASCSFQYFIFTNNSILNNLVHIFLCGIGGVLSE